MELVVLGLGSNRAFDGMDSLSLLQGALKELEKLLVSFRASSFYKTAPLHVEDQAAFINCAAAGLFSGEPEELLAAAQTIEAAFGRDRARERRWGERSLDIDILLFGSRVVRNPPLLEIPHPRLAERRFALECLTELESGARDPLTGRLYAEICAALPDQGLVPLDEKR